MPVSVPATCQTSALMNRNVLNSSSSGKARTSTLNSNGTWARARCQAQAINGTTP